MFTAIVKLPRNKNLSCDQLVIFICKTNVTLLTLTMCRFRIAQSEPDRCTSPWLELHVLFPGLSKQILGRVKMESII